MFNKKLFLKLCKKYKVEFSDKYNDTMIRNTNGNIEPLFSNDILPIVNVSKNKYIFDGIHNIYNICHQDCLCC